MKPIALLLCAHLMISLKIKLDKLPGGFPVNGYRTERETGCYRSDPDRLLEGKILRRLHFIQLIYMPVGVCRNHYKPLVGCQIS